MKILVPTKRVPDPDQRVRATACGTALDDSDLYYVPNPFDLIAVEEALVIKERETEEVEIVTVGVGVADYEKELRTTFAMGVDRALLVEAQAHLDPWNVASALMKVIEREQPDFVLMGKQAVDDDSNQTGQFLAALLNWPQATFASQLEFVDGGLRVHRETDLGIEVIRVTLPAVVTADLRLNEPRYASLPSILRAKKKSIEHTTPAELGAVLEPRVQLLSMEVVNSQRQCEQVKNAAELIAKLREAEVIEK